AGARRAATLHTLAVTAVHQTGRAHAAARANLAAGAAGPSARDRATRTDAAAAGRVADARRRTVLVAAAGRALVAAVELTARAGARPTLTDLVRLAGVAAGAAVRRVVLQVHTGIAAYLLRAGT